MSFNSSSLRSDTGKCQNESNNKFLEEVHLNNSNLIFIQLEDQCFAVAEVYRRTNKIWKANYKLDNPCQICNNNDTSPNSSIHTLEQEQTVSNSNLTARVYGDNANPNVQAQHHLHCTNMNEFKAAGGNSQSISETVRKCHLLFCLINGKGGILHRIGRGKKGIVDDSEYNRLSDSCKSMERIAELRKQLRKKKAALKSSLHVSDEYQPQGYSNENFINNSNSIAGDDITAHKQELEDEIMETEQTIASLIPLLPITSLRRDLQLHYDMVLRYFLFPSHTSEGSETQGHEKIASKNNREKLNSLDGSRNLDLDVTGTLMIGRLMDEILHKFRNGGLDALSTFYNGKLLWTQTQTLDKMSGLNPKNKNFLSREEILLLYKYITNMKGSDVPKKTKDSNSMSKRRIENSLFSFPTNKANINDEDQTAKSDYLPTISGEIGNFASPPTSSVNKEVFHSIALGSDLSVWVQNLYTLVDENHQRRDFLLQDNYFSHQSAGEYNVQKHKVMTYCCGKYHFILYFKESSLLFTESFDKIPCLEIGENVSSDGKFIMSSSIDQSSWKIGSLIDEEDNPCNPLVANVSLQFCEKIANCISKTITSYEEKRHKQYRRRQQEHLIQNINKYNGEPGLDIIFRDNCEHNVVIYTRSLGLKEKMNLFQSLSWNHNDYPRFLSGNLSHNVIMALDETFSEIKLVDKKSKGYSFPIRELCTFLPQKWVYGASHNHRELVIIFDARKFVSLNDVQKAACRVRNELLNGVLL